MQQRSLFVLPSSLRGTVTERGVVGGADLSRRQNGNSSVRSQSTEAGTWQHLGGMTTTVGLPVKIWTQYRMQLDAMTRALDLLRSAWVLTWDMRPKVS
jgi:hypothetical protein